MAYQPQRLEVELESVSFYKQNGWLTETNQADKGPELYQSNHNESAPGTSTIVL